MSNEKTVKLTVYTDEVTKAEWERLSKSRNRRPSAEADVALKQELERAYQSGELDRPGDIDKSTTKKVSYETAVAIVKVNADQGQTQTLAVIETAQVLGLDANKLLEACINAGLKPTHGNRTPSNNKANS